MPNNNNNNFAYGMSGSDDEADADPIAYAAFRRREDAAQEAMVHSMSGGVSEFAQSVGMGQAEAVAAKMAAEVAKQAAQKPITADDLQSNSSATTSKAPSMRPTEVMIMKRRIERIDDSLARAQMRSQLAQERLKNVVASGLVTDEGCQTDPNIAPLDTGVKRRTAAQQALMDPSAVDANSLGATSADGGGAGGGGGGVATSAAYSDEAQMEAVRKMHAMRGAGLLLMPAVPYEHFKYVPPDLSAHMQTGAMKMEAERKPGQAMVENKDLLKARLDQLQLANEELLVRTRVVPTQPDVAGSARVGSSHPGQYDPTSVLAPVDPRAQLALSPAGRAPPEHVHGSVVEHTAGAYRMPHQNVAPPAGGYGSVMDPASQRAAEQHRSEEQRWAMAKARNEAEGVTLTSRDTGPMGASALAQLRTSQDDTALLTNAALRTLPQGNMRDNYDARRKWDNVSFQVPGTRFGGTAMGEITNEAQKLYGFDKRDIG